MAPAFPAGAFYCLPILAALQPVLGALGCSVTLVPGLLVPDDHREGRENLDKRKIK